MLYWLCFSNHKLLFLDRASFVPSLNIAYSSLNKGFTCNQNTSLISSLATCIIQILLEIFHFPQRLMYLLNVCEQTDPKLPSLLKMLIWAQNQLDEKAVYPHINDLSTGQLEDPSE